MATHACNPIIEGSRKKEAKSSLASHPPQKSKLQVSNSDNTLNYLQYSLKSLISKEPYNVRNIVRMASYNKGKLIFQYCSECHRVEELFLLYGSYLF